VRVPEPVITDRAIIAAHLAAFGSPNVRRLYDAWRSTVTEIDDEEDLVREVCDFNSPDPPGLGVLKNLKVLQPKESAARQALADAVAEELGHRWGAAIRVNVSHSDTFRVLFTTFVRRGRGVRRCPSARACGPCLCSAPGLSSAGRRGVGCRRAATPDTGVSTG
jgi:hypothetical protein